jgi:hypothetical protein
MDLMNFLDRFIAAIRPGKGDDFHKAISCLAMFALECRFM